jgi:hypothetical protein
MKWSVWVMVLAMTLLWGVTAYAACPPRQTSGCAAQGLNLTGLPQISQQAAEHDVPPAATTKSPVATDAATPYTGPTLGVSDRVRRAPTVGYRWSLE